MVNKKKLFLTAGVALLSTSVLVACGKSEKSASNQSVYSYIYAADPDSLDYINTQRASTGDIITQGVDGLFENDKYGNVVGSLAKDWKVSADGLTYTYTLRDDAKWYTSEGEEYADVTAQDFVTGLKHAADSQSDALYVVQNSIKGLQDYVDGKTKDFSTVGVKALDDKTVQYTLNQPESYWNSKLTYSVLFPVNEEFLKSQGKDFGKVDPSSILYNGPFILKSLTAKSSVVFEKNPNYFDADKVKLDGIKLTYYDGSDSDSLYKNFADGVYSFARLFPNKPSYKEALKNYGDNIVYGLQDATTYFGRFNLDRSAYKFTAKTSDKQKEDTKAAILNKDFRQAINFALDRTAYSSQLAGEDAATKSLRNMLVPPTFVTSGEKTFGDLVKEQLASFGEEWSDVNLEDAQDGMYNVEKAKAEFAKAKEALQAQGVEFPIRLDAPVDQSSEVAVQQASSIKQSIEAALGSENVVVDVIKESTDDYDNTTYFAESAAQHDYDLYLTGGWGPDYQDPSTYLEVFDLEQGGLLQTIGLDPKSTSPAVAAAGLDEYTKLLNEANANKTDLAARYAAYAKVQAWLTDSGLTIPLVSRGGLASLTKLVPNTNSYGAVGVKGDSYYKYLELQDEPVKTADRDKAIEAWKAEKAKSNAEYEASLASHVEK
ncbi:peptide ABC transporter substrate-binding protein [Streptococcus cuniculipharyngis]|uniref:Peptide ABC transporter substrate-binding protein n=1 Tax=Streptococcus cuniculipharyngis TaxID=1562651 RepID=A0A5C5SCW6_9STRE|nr:peptide ABC transporter substrate-binding protein [Streptococcus cuniculipharyngis]TWS97427.1 peptide ABC transporter substrate-binding protein [Streptococcus cuniculipharyngis]